MEPRFSISLATSAISSFSLCKTDSVTASPSSALRPHEGHQPRPEALGVPAPRPEPPAESASCPTTGPRPPGLPGSEGNAAPPAARPVLLPLLPQVSGRSRTVTTGQGPPSVTITVTGKREAERRWQPPDTEQHLSGSLRSARPSPRPAAQRYPMRTAAGQSPTVALQGTSEHCSRPGAG